MSIIEFIWAWKFRPFQIVGIQVANIKTIPYENYFADTTNVKSADVGCLLSDTLRDLMHSTGVDDGLAALEYFSGCQGNFASTSRNKTCPSRSYWGRETCKTVWVLHDVVLRSSRNHAECHVKRLLKTKLTTTQELNTWDGVRGQLIMRKFTVVFSNCALIDLYCCEYIKGLTTLHS